MWAQVLRVNTFRTNGLFSPDLSQVNHAELTLPSDHRRNLDHWIDIRFGKNALSSRTLDIEAQNPQGSNL
jgi:hypothetical protein